MEAGALRVSSGLWGVAVVRGRSMLPTLHPGDRLLVRYGARARPGRIVLVSLPPGPDGPRPLAVKRLVCRGQDGSLWVESDARGVGVDSWSVGALEASALVATVVLRLPCRWPRPGMPRPRSTLG